MKLKTLLLTFLVVAVSTHAEVRTYTSSDGTAIKAEILKVEADTVTLRREDGKTFTVPVTRFSQADQATIRKDFTSKPPTSAPPTGTTSIDTIKEAIAKGTNSDVSYSAFGRSLVSVEGVKVTKEDFTNPSHYPSQSKTKAAGITNGLKLITKAVEENDFVLVPQGNSASPAFLYYKGPKGEIIGSKLSGGTWSSPSGVSISNSLPNWPIILGVLMGESGSVGMITEANKNNKPAWATLIYKINIK